MTKKYDSGMNRRDFEKLAAIGAISTMLPNIAYAGGPETNVSVSAVKKGASENALADAVKKAALSATNMSWLKKGDSVLIKVVINSGNGYPATTSPVGLAAMIELLKEKGADKVIVTDMSGIEHVKLGKKGMVKGSSRELLENCGLAKAASSAGAELYFPEDDGWDAFFSEAPEVGPDWKDKLFVPKKINEVDHIVLMPRCSRHLMAGSTLGLKAAVGWWRTDTRLEFHRECATFFEKIAQANTLPSIKDKQRLVLTTADKVLTTFGPDKGYVHEPENGLVIASESIIAHDMVSLAWLLEGRRNTPDEEKNGVSKDPHTSQTAVNMVAKTVTGLLGGAMQALKTESVTVNPVNTIWDCPTLASAFKVFGTTPKINMVNADNSVPEDIYNMLVKETTKA
jgi:uncharacterized protein (DUF362 family)